MFSIHVLRVCCILTTIFGVLMPVFVTGKRSSRRHAEDAVLRINVAVKIRLRSCTKEAAALDAAASSKALFLTGGRLVVVAAVGRAGPPGGCGRFWGSPARRRRGLRFWRRHCGLCRGSGGLGRRLPFL